MADARHGVAVAALANAHRNAKKRPDAYVATDFIPWHECHSQPPKPADPKVQAARVKAMLRAAASAAAEAEAKRYQG